MESCFGTGEGRYEKFKENFRQASKEKHQESFPVKIRSKKSFHFFSRLCAETTLCDVKIYHEIEN